MSGSQRRSTVKRAVQFFTSGAFLHHPFTSVWRRIVWRTHWRLRSEKPFTVDYMNGVKLRLAHSSASSGVYLNRGFSDHVVAEMFLSVIRPGMLVFDVGAHIGEYTVLFGKAVGRQGSVHAFEPDHRVMPFLHENVRINRLNNVVVSGLALSDAHGMESFTLQTDATASSLTKFAMSEGSRTLAVEVPTTTVDAYVDAAGIHALHVLKIDAEGAELAILKGGARTLQRLRPELVFAECHSADLADAAEDFLRDLGYIVEMDQQHEYPHLRAWAHRPNVT
jgi:FkbM family methyltransferase